ncbi:hypothetical protein ACFLVH_03530 [Chloroflexota bacterium]
MSEDRQQMPRRLINWPESSRPKKRVEMFANEKTGEFTYKKYEDEQLVQEIKKPEFIVESAKGYMEYWEDDKRQHRFWEGSPEFEKADRPNRQVSMAEARAIMETWFESGVTYDYDFIAAIFNTMVYTNEPGELQGVLEIAFGKIKANILEWKRIPEYVRPQLLMWSPALPLAPYGLKGEHKATFEQKVNGPSYGPMFWTEGMPAKERAELVSNNWYDLQSHRLYGFISEIYATESDQWKRPQSLRAVEKYLDAEQRLKDLGLDLPARLEYYGRWLGFQNTEVSEMLQTIGVNKKPEAVKKSYQRHRELMRVSYENF